MQQKIDGQEQRIELEQAYILDQTANDMHFQLLPNMRRRTQQYQAEQVVPIYNPEQQRSKISQAFLPILLVSLRSH